MIQIYFSAFCLGVVDLSRIDLVTEEYSYKLALL